MIPKPLRPASLFVPENLWGGRRGRGRGRGGGAGRMPSVKRTNNNEHKLSHQSGLWPMTGF